MKITEDRIYLGSVIFFFLSIPFEGIIIGTIVLILGIMIGINYSPSNKLDNKDMKKTVKINDILLISLILSIIILIGNIFIHIFMNNSAGDGWGNIEGTLSVLFTYFLSIINILLSISCLKSNNNSIQTISIILLILQFIAIFYGLIFAF